MILKRINEILRAVTENAELVVDYNTDLIEDVNLDSLTMIRFILDIEDTFDIEIEFEEMDFEHLKKMQNFITLINKKIQQGVNN